MTTDTKGEDPRRLGPAGGEQVAEVGEEGGVPARRAGAHADDGALHRRRGPVVGEEEEDGGQAPVPRPHDERRDGAADALRRRGGRHAHRSVASLCISPGRPRPGHEPEQPVHEDRAGRSRQRTRGAGEEHAHALADDPDPESPDEGHGERRLDRVAEEETDADEELDQREERVPDRDVRSQEVPDMGDEVTQHEGLALRVGQDEARDEAPAEHEGLELQGRVEDPEQAEDDLEDALGADGEREAADLAGRRALVRRLECRRCVHAPLYATGGVRDGIVTAWRVHLHLCRPEVPAGSLRTQLEVLGDGVGRRDRLPAGPAMVHTLAAGQANKRRPGRARRCGPPGLRPRPLPPPASGACPWRRRRAWWFSGRRGGRCRCPRNPGASSA